MASWRSWSLCRSIVRGLGIAGGRGCRYRSIRAPAVTVVASVQIHIGRRRPLLPAVVCCGCLTVERRTFCTMAAAGSQNTGDPGVVLKLVAASVSIADRAGGIVRNIMSAGNLGIVEKVWCSWHCTLLDISWSLCSLSSHFVLFIYLIINLVWPHQGSECRYPEMWQAGHGGWLVYEKVWLVLLFSVFLKPFYVAWSFSWDNWFHLCTTLSEKKYLLISNWLILAVFQECPLVGLSTFRSKYMFRDILDSSHDFILNASNRSARFLPSSDVHKRRLGSLSL